MEQTLPVRLLVKLLAALPLRLLSDLTALLAHYLLGSHCKLYKVTFMNHCFFPKSIVQYLVQVILFTVNLLTGKELLTVDISMSSIKLATR